MKVPGPADNGYLVIDRRRTGEDDRRALDRVLAALEREGWRSFGPIEEIQVLLAPRARYAVRQVGRQHLLIGDWRGTDGFLSTVISRSAGPADLARGAVASGWGRYILVWRDDEGRLALLRDPSGALDCVWWRHGGAVIAAREPPRLVDALLPADLAIDWPVLGEIARTPELLGDRLALRGLTAVNPGAVSVIGEAAETAAVWRPTDFCRAGRRCGLRHRGVRADAPRAGDRIAHRPGRRRGVLPGAQPRRSRRPPPPGGPGRGVAGLHRRRGALDPALGLDGAWLRPRRPVGRAGRRRDAPPSVAGGGRRPAAGQGRATAAVRQRPAVLGRLPARPRGRPLAPLPQPAGGRALPGHSGRPADRRGAGPGPGPAGLRHAPAADDRRAPQQGRPQPFLRPGDARQPADPDAAAARRASGRPRPAGPQGARGRTDGGAPDLEPRLQPATGRRRAGGLGPALAGADRRHPPGAHGDRANPGCGRAGHAGWPG